MLASRTHLLNAQRRARPAQSHTSLQLEPQGLHTTHPLTPAPRLLPLNASGSEATAQSSAPAAKDTVTVFFKQTGRSTEAKAGEHLMDAAARCGADKEIQTGCYSGSCGICEVELHKWGLDGTPGKLTSGCNPSLLALSPRGLSHIDPICMCAMWAACASPKALLLLRMGKYVYGLSMPS